MNKIIKKIEEEIEKWKTERNKYKETNPYFDMLNERVWGLQKSIELIKSTYTCKDCESWTPENYTGHCSKINKLTDCDYRCEGTDGE